MAEVRKFVRVFIGSPGDLAAERSIARTVADEVNQQWGDFAGCHIELVGWEDTLPGVGRPQEIINRDLDRCEHFLGMIWKRWGTAPGTGAYTSGFEEEFRRSSARNHATGKPEISLFFKQVPDESLRDPGDQLRKVLTFKDELIASRQFLFKEFIDEKDFEGKLRAVLSAIIRQSAQQNEATSQEASRPAASSDEELINPHDEADTSQAPNNIDFARQFLLRSVEEGFRQEEHPLEIARLRLVTSTLRTAANDAMNVGVGQEHAGERGVRTANFLLHLRVSSKPAGLRRGMRRKVSGGSKTVVVGRADSLSRGLVFAALPTQCFLRRTPKVRA